MAEPTITIVPLTDTHVKCNRCYRFVLELFPKWAEKDYPPICSRCCQVIYDMEHGIIGADVWD